MRRRRRRRRVDCNPCIRVRNDRPTGTHRRASVSRATSRVMSRAVANDAIAFDRSSVSSRARTSREARARRMKTTTPRRAFAASALALALGWVTNDDDASASASASSREDADLARAVAGARERARARRRGEGDARRRRRAGRAAASRDCVTVEHGRGEKIREERGRDRCGGGEGTARRGGAFGVERRARRGVVDDALDDDAPDGETTERFLVRRVQLLQRSEGTAEHGRVAQSSFDEGRRADGRERRLEDYRPSVWRRVSTTRWKN